MTDIKILVELAAASYNVNEENGSPTVGTNGSYVPISNTPTIDLDTGFRAQAHYAGGSENTLVITYTGTNDEAHPVIWSAYINPYFTHIPDLQ